MNGCLLTSLIILVCTFASCETAYGQPSGYSEIPHRAVIQETPNGCRPETGIYDQPKLDALKQKPYCGDLFEGSPVDAQARSLAYYSVSSDCHMRVALKVFRVDAEKKYKLIINNIYGGCRASGSRKGWIEFEKLPDGYEFEMIEIRVDRDRPGDAKEFVYPRPPSVITQEDLPIREISVNNCFELTGQSQWIIQNKQILLDGLKYKPNEKECSAAVAGFDVDFEKETLVGYSFASGHCNRPPELTFSSTKETSNYPDENRVVIKATYERAEVGACKVWTTYPVWLVLPKQQTYRFDLSAAAN